MKKTFWQAVKYLLFSAGAAIIQAGSFALMYNLMFKESWYSFSYVVSLILSVLWSFTLNRKYTFASVNNVPVAMLKVIGYYLVFTPVSTWVGQVMESAGWNGNLVQALNMLANLITEFIFWKLVVFKEKKVEN